MKSLPILVALLWSSPALAACVWSTIWPACTVQYSDGTNVEDTRDEHQEFAFASLPACGASNKLKTYFVNDAPSAGTCSGGGSEYAECMCDGLIYIPLSGGSGGGGFTPNADPSVDHSGMSAYAKLTSNQFTGSQFFDGTLCDDNVTPGVCDSGATRWNISGNGTALFSQTIYTDQFLPADTAWLTFGNSVTTDHRLQTSSGYAFIDAGFGMQEQASWPGAWGAGYGWIWVKNDTPNTLWFHDDGGTERRLGAVQGNCTVQPCFDGSSDGGTSLSLYDATSTFNGTLAMHPGGLTANAEFRLLKAAGPVSTTLFNIPVTNWGTTQNWAGAQSFNNSTAGAGTKISLLRTNQIKSATSGGIITIGDIDDADSDDNQQIILNAEDLVRITTDVGESVFDGGSMDFEETALGPTPLSSHGAFWILSGAENWPAFTSEADVDYTIAAFDRAQSWTAAQDFTATNSLAATAAANDDDTSIATTAFVQTELRGVKRAPCMYIENPVSSEQFESVFRAPVALTISEIWCETDAGTVGLDLNIDDGTPLAINGSDISCAVSPGTADSTFGNSASLAAGNRLDVDVGTVTTATKLRICFTYSDD